MLGTLCGFQCQRGKCCRSGTYCTEIHSDQWRIYVYLHSHTRFRNTLTHIQIPQSPKTRTFINLFLTRPSWKMSCQPLRSRGPGGSGGKAAWERRLSSDPRLHASAARTLDRHPTRSPPLPELLLGSAHHWRQKALSSRDSGECGVGRKTNLVPRKIPQRPRPTTFDPNKKRVC